MKQTLFFIISALIIVSCVDKKQLNNSSSSTNFPQFDKAFAKMEWKDTLDSEVTDWALGYSYEIKSPILDNELFYSVLDTSKMTYRFWEDRIYAEAKIDLPNNHVGYFTSRQTGDITYDRTTVLIIIDKDGNYVQDFVFSEFIGYEGYVTETQSRLIRHSDNSLKIYSTLNISHYDYDKGRMVKRTKLFDKTWLKSGFYLLKSFD